MVAGVDNLLPLDCGRCTTNRQARFASSFNLSLVRIDETEAALAAFDYIDRDNVLTAVSRGKSSRGFVPVVVVFRRHLFPGFIINADGNLFHRFRGANGEPVLISRVKIHSDERVFASASVSARTAMLVPSTKNQTINGRQRFISASLCSLFLLLPCQPIC